MAERSHLALVIDLGTTGLKVGLSTLDGTLLSSLGAQLSTEYGEGGRASQDATIWWHHITRLSRQLLETVEATSIAAVAITGQYASIVPVDESGTPTSDCVLWMDTQGGIRTRERVGGPIAGLKPLAALRFVRRTGGAPTPSGADGTGGLLHLLVDRKDVVERSRWLLEPTDYLSMRFTGTPATTHATMIGWWLTDNRHVNRLTYDEVLLKTLGVDASLLAPLVPFGSITGAVTAQAALATGVPEGTPVLAGSPDLHAATLGAGTTTLGGPGHLALSTSSWISAPMTKKKTDIFHSIATMPGLDPDSYLIVNNHEIGAKALEWLAGAIGVPQPVDFSALTEEARSAPAGAGSVIFTPWLAGERSPVESHSARGGFHNLSLSTTRPDLVRAVMEGVAYNSRWLAEYVDKFAGRVLEPMRLIGGGAASELWCQIHADVMGRPVDQVAEPMVAQLRGVGMLAGRTLGAITDDEIPSLTKIAKRFEPDASTAAAYDRLYAEFPRLISTQRPMFKRLQRP